MQPELYSEEDINVIEEHIINTIGDFHTVIHEIVSPDIHVDIAVVPPSEKHDFYTLVTIGMGAHRMNVPEDMRGQSLDRAELAICLPPDWNIESSERNYSWPIRLLKFLARLPINENNWLGYGHTVDLGTPVADNCEFSAALLLPMLLNRKAGVCNMPDGSKVNFYLVMPIYNDEMEYKIKSSTLTLLSQFDDNFSPVVDITRSSILNRIEDDIPMDILDRMEWHVGSIRDKQLPVDELTGYNHMAIYLRWCIENNMMCREFEQSFPGIVKKLRSGDTSVPLRELIKIGLGGIIYKELFNDVGQRFADFYYRHGNGKHCYPADVDRYAMRYFGLERYHSKEFQDEAYLFVPYNEEYYQGMKKVIETHYKMFLKENSK